MSERKSQQELDFERKHEEDLQRLRGLRLIDDDFMAAVFEERACAEFLLQIILKRDDLTVKEVHGQYSIKICKGVQSDWIFWQWIGKTVHIILRCSAVTVVLVKSAHGTIAVCWMQT